MPVALVMAMLMTAAAQACPSCREAVGEASALANEDSASVARERPSPFDPPPVAVGDFASSGDLAAGFSYSIYAMLAVPYLMLAAGGFGIHYYLKRHGTSA